MAMPESTRREIKTKLKESLLRKINEYELDTKDAAKPFQYALFTRDRYLVKSFIHGCETSLGNWHEVFARIIAKDKFKVAKKLTGTDKLIGKISEGALQKMEQILSDLDDNTRTPDIAAETDEIYKARKQGDSIKREQTVDLYLEKEDGSEVYIEMKGPKPNKNEVKVAKKDLFEIYGIRANEGKKVEIYLGMHYNSYAPERYDRWTVTKFFQLGNDFVVGDSFWDFIGGEGTYGQLIKIYDDVGKEIALELKKKLGSIKDE